jgi:predicted DNA-binding protein
MSSPQQTPYPLRMPEDLRKRIEELAKANGRSVNAEILAHIQRSIDMPMLTWEFDEMAERLAEKIAEKLKPNP